MRRAMAGGRRELSKTERETWETCIKTHIMHSLQRRGAGSVLGYLACDGEVNLDALLDVLEANGAAVFLPRVRDKSRRKRDAVLVPVPWRDYVVAGAYNIREPRPDLPPSNPALLEAVLVPGVAFCRNGTRIGFGGGFYDRYLPLLCPDALIIGVAFDLQIVDTLPCEDHDVRVHEVCSESGCIKTTRPGATA